MAKKKKKYTLTLKDIEGESHFGFNTDEQQKWFESEEQRLFKEGVIDYDPSKEWNKDV